jgi:hypothetical protein
VVVVVVVVVLVRFFGDSKSVETRMPVIVVVVECIGHMKNVVSFESGSL